MSAAKYRICPLMPTYLVPTYLFLLWRQTVAAFHHLRLALALYTEGLPRLGT